MLAPEKRNRNAVPRLRPGDGGGNRRMSTNVRWGFRDWGDRSGRSQSYFRFDNIYSANQMLSFGSGDVLTARGSRWRCSLRSPIDFIVSSSVESGQGFFKDSVGAGFRSRVINGFLGFRVKS